MHTFAEFAVEAVAVKQRQPDLEVGFFAVVRGSGHQQEMATDTTEQLTQLEAFAFVDFVATIVGGEFVRFVNDDEIPGGVFQFGLIVGIARQLIQAADQAVTVGEVIARGGLFLFFAAEQGKFHVKFFQHFILPLLTQRTGGNNQDTLRVCPYQ